MAVTACGRDKEIFDKNGDFKIRDAGPDEFAIVPTKELEIPEDTTTLPEPALGSVNRVDLVPQKDAVAALGGQPDRLDSTLVANDEQALIAAASRNGVSADIRDQIAEDDKKFNKRNRRKNFERWFGFGSRLKTYQNESIEQTQELNRLRRQGVRTPSVTSAE